LYVCITELQQLTGIAAILRFPILDMEDEDEDVDQEASKNRV